MVNLKILDTQNHRRDVLLKLEALIKFEPKKVDF